MAYWVEKLELLPHPEGGFYKEVYRPDEKIPAGALPDRFKGDRILGSGIYFLIHHQNFSAFHRLQGDELWHFYAGDTVSLHLIHPDGRYELRQVGNDLEIGAAFQVKVPALCWFAASVDAPDGYALVGCTMAPGFDFEDFEMAERESLTSTFPRHRSLIERFTR